MTLAIIEGKGVACEPFPAGHRHAGRRIQSPAQQTDSFHSGTLDANIKPAVSQAKPITNGEIVAWAAESRCTMLMVIGQWPCPTRNAANNWAVPNADQIPLRSPSNLPSVTIAPRV